MSKVKYYASSSNNELDNTKIDVYHEVRFSTCSHAKRCIKLKKNYETKIQRLTKISILLVFSFSHPSV